MLYKAGDWNICDGGRDDVRDDEKKEMAEELLSSFIHEMQDLGFEKDDIISKIADYKEERR